MVALRAYGTSLYKRAQVGEQLAVRGHRWMSSAPANTESSYSMNSEGDVFKVRDNRKLSLMIQLAVTGG